MGSRKQHPWYCGIDLHARSLDVCIVHHDGEIVVHRIMTAAPEPFLKAVAPSRDGLAACCPRRRSLPPRCGRPVTCAGGACLACASGRHCWRTSQRPRVRTTCLRWGSRWPLRPTVPGRRTVSRACCADQYGGGPRADGLRRPAAARGGLVHRGLAKQHDPNLCYRLPSVPGG
jgi:hypothetical protein